MMPMGISSLFLLVFSSGGIRVKRASWGIRYRAVSAVGGDRGRARTVQRRV